MILCQIRKIGWYSNNVFGGKCGCCPNLHRSNLYVDLDRGDGVCKYLDGNLHSIYEIRYLKCRVDEIFNKFWNQNSIGRYTTNLIIKYAEF